MRREKLAVFQVNDTAGVTRLVAVRGVTFAHGTRLEAALRAMRGHGLHVTFLGRFDHVETVQGAADLLNLAQQRPEIVPLRHQALRRPRGSSASGA